MSTARMRKIISSSTTRTFGTAGKSVDTNSLTLPPASRLQIGLGRVARICLQNLPGRSAAAGPLRRGPLLRLSSRYSELFRAARPIGDLGRRLFRRLAPLSHQPRQMRRHSSRLPIQTKAEPFADFFAKRQIIAAADLRGMSHEKSNGPIRQMEEIGKCYRRAVTRRASTTVVCEAGLRRQDAA